MFIKFLFMPNQSTHSGHWVPFSCLALVENTSFWLLDDRPGSRGFTGQWWKLLHASSLFLSSSSARGFRGLNGGFFHPSFGSGAVPASAPVFELYAPLAKLWEPACNLAVAICSGSVARGVGSLIFISLQGRGSSHQGGCTVEERPLPALTVALARPLSCLRVAQILLEEFLRFPSRWNKSFIFEF